MMKSRTIRSYQLLPCLVALVLTLLLSSGTVLAGENKDLLATALNAGSFNTFVKAVKAAGLEETLQGKTPVTVFAPTDEAFDKLPDGVLDKLLQPENKDKLKSVLARHMALGKLMERHLTHMNWARTLDNGKKVVLQHKNGSLLFAKRAELVKMNIECCNGVIHGIDTVILPKDI